MINIKDRKKSTKYFVKKYKVFIKTIEYINVRNN